ncbi:hypothetical protein ADK67_14980 [Saccharothrix sp. NRRL B-16348]|nr:hypothetical protein ADK67_14980 [Saccharothrix sp. NRRL B-16348]
MTSPTVTISTTARTVRPVLARTFSIRTNRFFDMATTMPGPAGRSADRAGGGDWHNHWQRCRTHRRAPMWSSRIAPVSLGYQRIPYRVP